MCCRECRKQFTARVGTVFEDVHIPLHKMLQEALDDLQQEGLSAHQQHRTQLDKFKDAARSQGCDDDPNRFKERLGKLVKYEPVEKSE